MKKVILLSLLSLSLYSCAPSACQCSDEFYSARQYGSGAADVGMLKDCMKLYYKEKGITPPTDIGADFMDASYYFMNHPCHEDE